jgi:CRP-like cAMP-binding protein
MADPRPSASPSQLLISRLAESGPLSHADRTAISALPMRLQVFAANDEVVSQGRTSSECCLVVDGLLCRYKAMADGRRQIIALLAPGDMPDLQSLHLNRMDHNVAALSRGGAAFIPQRAMRELMAKSPAVTAGLWRETLVDAAVTREWVVGLGRRSAYSRLAHLFCELTIKLERAGMRNGDHYPLPLRQHELADTLGLSLVHLNRVLQQLRRIGAVEVRGGMLKVTNWRKLTEAAEFDPDYLHLPQRQSAA